jgi:hypothetical protein
MGYFDIHVSLLAALTIGARDDFLIAMSHIPQGGVNAARSISTVPGYNALAFGAPAAVAST